MPNDNLNRENLPKGWENAWPKIDAAVNAAAEAASVAPKIITPQKVPGALDVPNHTLERTKVASNSNGTITVASISEGGKVPLVKTEARFSLTETQVTNVANGTEMEGVTTLATMMATQVAQATDAIIFRDPNRNNWGDQFPSVLVTGTLATKGGLLGAAEEEIEVDPADLSQGGFGEQIVVAVAKAYAYLASKKGDPGPYKAVLPANVYSDHRAPLLPLSLITPDERTKFPSLDEIYGTGTLPDLQGLFVSPLYGHRINLFYGQDLITGFDRSEQGIYYFRVFQRFQLVVVDPAAALKLAFTDKEPARSEKPPKAQRPMATAA